MIRHPLLVMPQRDVHEHIAHGSFKADHQRLNVLAGLIFFLRGDQQRRMHAEVKTLIIQGALTLNDDSTYTYTFKKNRNGTKADQVIANGVTINSGAMIALSGHTSVALRQGLVLTLISNTSANPISGTFSNLPDGGIVTINGNNLQASYEGGDGNDLTLTVVP